MSKSFLPVLARKPVRCWATDPIVVQPSPVQGKPRRLGRVAYCAARGGVGVQRDTVQKLKDARQAAISLFKSVSARGLLSPGKTESQIEHEVFKLADAEHGTRQHWHPRMPRNGTNTLSPIFVDCPDVPLKGDDICFLDLGPVFRHVEADFARTYVMGDDAAKHKLNDTLPVVFNACKGFYLKQPDVTGAEFFDFVKGYAASELFLVNGLRAIVSSYSSTWS